jgi:hypothetical protein
MAQMRHVGLQILLMPGESCIVFIPALRLDRV